MSSENDFRRHALKAGAFALVGWTIAAVVYFTAPPDTASPLAEYEASKTYDRSMQQMGGAAEKLWYQTTDAISACFHGQTLGITIFVIVTIAAFAYLFPKAPR
ncbi:MAG TPA: hypothetical protein VF407_10270 [Polyangiaceae bacterium]